MHTHLCPTKKWTPNSTNKKQQHRAMHFAIALFFRNQSTLDRNSVFRTKTSFILPFIQPHKIYMIEHRTPLRCVFRFFFIYVRQMLSNGLSQRMNWKKVKIDDCVDTAAQHTHTNIRINHDLQ